MKHPLTSKERRGLVAVAAAALLCIASGFIFRNCSSRDALRANPEDISIITNQDSLSTAEAGQHVLSDKTTDDNLSNGKRNRRIKRRNSSKSSGEKKQKNKKNKTPKTYPTRDPLSQPCD